MTKRSVVDFGYQTKLSLLVLDTNQNGYLLTGSNLEIGCIFLARRFDQSVLNKFWSFGVADFIVHFSTCFLVKHPFEVYYLFMLLSNRHQVKASK